MQKTLKIQESESKPLIKMAKDLNRQLTKEAAQVEKSPHASCSVSRVVASYSDRGHHGTPIRAAEVRALGTPEAAAGTPTVAGGRAEWHSRRGSHCRGLLQN